MWLLKALDKRLAKWAKALIRLYQATISPDEGVFKHIFSGTVCAHEPHCSSYALTCYERYGFIRWTNFTLDRVMSCTPSTTTSYDPPYYRVVFASGSPIGIPFLEQIVDDERFELIGVLTAPDKPVGRGQNIQPNPVKKAALNYLSNDQIFTPHSLRTDSQQYSDEAQNTHDWLQEIQPDFLVVVAYGQIIPQELLDLPRIAPVNVHGSLLPKYRGASPLQAAFLNQDDTTGMTIMQMEATLDTGPIIDTKAVKMPFDRTVRQLITWMKEKGPAFLTDTMRAWWKEELEETPQDDEAASYYGKIDKQQWAIDPNNDPLETIYAKYRAFALWPKVYRHHNDQRVIIETVALDQEAYEQHHNEPLLLENNSLNPAVTSMKLKPQGKQAMSREDFRNGYLQEN